MRVTFGRLAKAGLILQAFSTAENNRVCDTFFIYTPFSRVIEYEMKIKSVPSGDKPKSFKKV